jgi:hypothetical protein
MLQLMVVVASFCFVFLPQQALGSVWKMNISGELTQLTDPQDRLGFGDWIVHNIEVSLSFKFRTPEGSAIHLYPDSPWSDWEYEHGHNEFVGFQTQSLFYFPLPPTLSLMLLGLISFGCARRRHKHPASGYPCNVRTSSSPSSRAFIAATAAIEAAAVVK